MCLQTLHVRVWIKIMKLTVNAKFVFVVKMNKLKDHGGRHLPMTTVKFQVCIVWFSLCLLVSLYCLYLFIYMYRYFYGTIEKYTQMYQMSAHFSDLWPFLGSLTTYSKKLFIVGIKFVSTHTCIFIMLSLNSTCIKGTVPFKKIIERMIM